MPPIPKNAASQRNHNAGWMLFKIDTLVDEAKRLKDSSKLLYACLEARNLLEFISTMKVLTSVPADERRELLDAMQSKNGIERTAQKIKTLGLKFQLFLEVVMENNGLGQVFPVYKFNESSKLQHELSTYIHGGAIVEPQLMVFGSSFLQPAFTLIEKAVQLARESTIPGPHKYIVSILNAEYSSMPAWTRELYDEWKLEVSNDKDKLREKLKPALTKYMSMQSSVNSIQPNIS